MVGEMVIYDNGPDTKCVGIVLTAVSVATRGYPDDQWLEVLWDDGIIEGIYLDEVSFVERIKK